MASSLKHIVRRAIPRPLRNWLRSPSITLRWWLNNQRQPLNYAIRPDWQLKCPLNAFGGSFRLQLQDRPQIRELDEFIALIQHSPGVQFMDIGCHFGIFSFAALHYGGPAARALAVDPSGFAGAMLQRIASLNGYDSRLRFLRAAAGAEAGELKMVDTGVSAAGYMVMPGDQTQTDCEFVPQNTLDQFTRQMDSAPTIIKIDVESYELEVLRGGKETLSTGKVILCLEIHNQMMRDRNVNPQLVLDQLHAYGYRQFTCEGKTLLPAELLVPEIIRVIARK